jgi:hypothetical protein
MTSGDVGGIGVVEAIVQTGEVETGYRRAGRGRPLVLLSDATPEERDRVFQRLAGTAMVVEPLLPPPPSEWPRWLRGVIDGLGLDCPDLVVVEAWVGAAEAFALGDPDRAGRVVAIGTIDP